jgi:hypothetical protein
MTCDAKPNEPNVTLARQLFLTDPRVQAFLDARRETLLNLEHYKAVLACLWTEDEQGWRSEAESRAFEMGLFADLLGSVPW